MPRQRRRIVEDDDDESDNVDIEMAEEEEVTKDVKASGGRRRSRGKQSKRRPVLDSDNDDVDKEDNDDDNIEMAEEETKKDAKASGGKRRSRGKESKRKPVLDSDNDDDEKEDIEDDNNDEVDVESSQDTAMRFSSQAPDMTQDIGEVKVYERNNLEKLSEIQRNKAITDLTRLVLFKALAGEAIDKSKCIKEAGIQDARISSAAFDEVNYRLKNMFDFELARQPEWMNKMKGSNSIKYTKDRHYLINACNDEADGVHSRALHSIHEQSSIEKGLLMVVLAFTYCKGEPRNDGSRWILDKHLYQLLNKIDENIPADPPVSGSKRNRSGSSTVMMMSQSSSPTGRGSNTAAGSGGVAQTPDVDAALEKFVKRDYLLKEKATDDQINTGGVDVDENSIFYTMGPRAAIEIGRKQVIYFCSEILDEEPDPTMLSELETFRDDDDEEEGQMGDPTMVSAEG